jgi:hypothetical protein
MPLNLPKTLFSYAHVSQLGLGGLMRMLSVLFGEFGLSLPGDPPLDNDLRA